ncbi:MAG TPA: sigma 54-interacting transcriptional regulator [Syntrophorhabdaceae bacterium]|jgi:DNA-binding NtrC family response regulator/polyferredoxin
MTPRELIDRLPLLAGISDEAAEHIHDYLTVRTFQPGENVFMRGEPGNSMFVILEGRIGVTLTNAEGYDYTIANLQEGSFFGELGLLAGEPRSAHLKVLTPLLVVEIGQEGYAGLIRVFPELNDRLMQVLERRASKRKMKWQGERVRSVKGVTQSLVHARDPLNEECLPGVTEWAGELNRLVGEIAATDAHVMISGEAGTERVFVARLLISKSGAKDLPFISLNCSTPPKVHREATPTAVGDAQESAIFGHVAGSAPYAAGWRRGYLEIGDTGTLVLDHVEDLTPKVQALLLGYLKTNRYSRAGSDEERTSKVRIIATTTRDLDEAVARGRFNKELLDLLRERSIKIIPLRERREDIPALAQEFLVRYRRRNREQIGRFSKEAMNALVGHDWPLNFAELNTVISQAVAASQGKTVEEEHIFFDIRSSLEPAGGINLLSKKGIGGVLRHRLFPGALRYVTVPLFLCLVFYTLFGPREQNLGNIIAWALLWPALLLSVVVSGRGFCAYCPISAVSEAFAYGRSKFLSLPQVIRKYGMWAGIAAFVSIFWVEHVTKAFLNARVTGAVFLSISSGAIIATLLFGRRIWCLHICPMGRMLGDLAVLSVVELRANSRVCVWQCENRACLKEKNCPMALHPSAERTRHDCILCMTCAKKCKQKSVHLDLLPPHQRVLAMKSWSFSRTAFVVLLTGSVLVSQALVWLGSHKELGVLKIPDIHFQGRVDYFLAGIAMTAGYAALAFLASRAPGARAWSRNFVQAGYPYLPLAFFGLFDVYFGQFIDRAPQLLARLPGLSDMMNGSLTGAGLAVLHALPAALALAGGALSLYLLRKLRDQYRIDPLPYRLHQALILLTSLVFALVF